MSSAHETFIPGAPTSPTTIKERALHARNWMKKFDAFKFVPSPRWVSGEQISVRGLIGTTVLWIIVFVYLGISVSRFLDDEPSVSLVDAEPSNDLIAFPPVGITFRRNVDGRPLEFFYNESFFRVHFEQVTGAEQDLEPRKKIDLGTKPCNLESWAGWSGNSSICPIQAPKIGGRYQSEKYVFFGIHVTICDPASPFVSNATGVPENVVCAPRSEIDAVLTNGRFNVLADYTSFDNPDGIFESNWYLYNPLLRQLFEGIYHKRITSLNPNYLWSWASREVVALRLSVEKALSTVTSLAPQYGGGRVVLSIYARTDSFDVVESRQRATSLDLIGSWYALYGAFFGFLAIYFSWYNEKKFYEKHPGWDDLESFPFIKETEEESELLNVPAESTTTI